MGNPARSTGPPSRVIHLSAPSGAIVSAYLAHGGQESHSDTGHRDEHDDDEHPAATVMRRIAMRVSVQRVMRNAALRADPDGRVGAVNARCIDDYDNEPGQNQSEQHEDRDNAEGFRRPGEVLEQVYVDPAYTTRPITLPIATQAHPRRQ